MARVVAVLHADQGCQHAWPGEYVKATFSCVYGNDTFRRHAAGLRVLTAKEIQISADAAQIPVGIDGEAVSMSTPVTCTISPSALRVWVPRDPARRAGAEAPGELGQAAAARGRPR